MVTNQIKKIREKLDSYGKIFISRENLEKLTTKFSPSYTVTDLCRKKVITPIKRSGNMYINNMSKEVQDPYQTASLYFQGEIYTFGGLGVYATYGYSTQMIEWYTVYNTHVSGKRIIGNVKFIFLRQREWFFYGITTASNKFGQYQVMSPERAFIQMLREGKKWEEIPNNIDRKILLSLSKQYASKALYAKILALCS
jgi:hypothetical protein